MGRFSLTACVLMLAGVALHAQGQFVVVATNFALAEGANSIVLNEQTGVKITSVEKGTVKYVRTVAVLSRKEQMPVCSVAGVTSLPSLPILKGRFTMCWGRKCEAFPAAIWSERHTVPTWHPTVMLIFTICRCPIILMSLLMNGKST